jgi:hypothetical protein
MQMDACQKFGLYNHVHQSYIIQRAQSSHNLLVEPSPRAVTKQITIRNCLQSYTSLQKDIITIRNFLQSYTQLLDKGSSK